MIRAALPAIVVGLVSIVPIGGVLFVCAGRWDLPWFWVYFATWVASALVGPLVADPTLLHERMLPGPGAKDLVFTVFLVPILALPLIVTGLDVGRFHWSDGVSTAVHVFGLLAMIVALAVMIWAIAVNRFFSSVIRIQTDRGHHLVTGGPYRYVRHPAYAVAPLLFVGAGLVLGSWLGVLACLPALLGVLRRTVQEDRVLREELPGYGAYAEKVRYRLLPGVW